MLFIIIFINIWILEQNNTNLWTKNDLENNKKKESFYEELDRLYESTKMSHPKVILRDFNAKIGKKEIYRPTIGKESLHILSNDNENRFITFAIPKRLRVNSTPPFHIKTFTKKHGCHLKETHQVDHVMTDLTINKIIKDVRSYYGVTAQSDHFQVEAKVQIKIQKKKMNKKFKTFI